MAISFEAVDQMRSDLGMEYMQRHTDLRKLRDYWQGRWWQNWTTERKGLASLFRDIARKADDAAPDYKIIHNILQEVCLKYQAFLSELPMIRVYVDPPESSNRRRQAIVKERYLYSTWAQRPFSMAQAVNHMAWYLPLMGDTFLGALPDIENNIIRPVVRSPEWAYPVPSYDGSTLDAVIFSWETPKSVAAKQFPSYNPMRADSKRGLLRKTAAKKNDKVRITEYSDGTEFARWVDGQQVAGVEHDYGFNLFDQLGFITVPGEPFNHGAVEQIVSMNEAENLMRSLLLQAVVENIFPKYVLIDPSKAPEELDMGPGAVWGVNQGGDVKTLSPPLQALPVQQGFLAENERAIKQGAGMSDANFGQPRGSIVTGKAINEMESAGAGTNVDMVQGLGIGLGLVSWNEKAICMGRKMFREEKMNLTGVEKVGLKALGMGNRPFSFSIEGKELIGGYRNEVEFLPHLEDHEKLVMGLQGLGANIFSREHVRNTVGIPDSAAMDDEILGEKVSDIVLGALEQELLASPTPESAVDIEKQGLAFLQGATQPGGSLAGPPSAAPGGAPLPSSGPAPPGGGGGGGIPIQTQPGGGQLMAKALQLPPGAALAQPDQGTAPGPQGGPPPPQGGSDQSITLDQAVQAFQGLSGIVGRVFLVGAIVQDNQTSDRLEVAVTDNADKQTITDGLPQWAPRIVFHKVSGEPGEQHVEVTPGSAPEVKGQQPDLSALLG